MHLNNKPNKKNETKSLNTDPKGTCIISFSNGHKECALDTTTLECNDICNNDPGSKCELSSDNKCPRGT